MNTPADAHAKQLKPSLSSSLHAYSSNRSSDMQLRSRAASNAAKPNYVDPSSTSSEEELEDEEPLSSGEADVEKTKGKGKKKGDKKGTDGKANKGKGKARALPQDSEGEDAEDADDADEEEADMDIDEDSAEDPEEEYDNDVSPVKSKATPKGKGKAAVNTPQSSTRRRAVRGQQPQATSQSPKSSRKPLTPRQPRLKITLKLPQAPGSTSATPTPGVESEDVPQGRTRAKGATTKRSAAVRSRRRIQDMDSSSEQEGPESQDDEGEDEVDVDGEEDEGEEEVDVEEEEQEVEGEGEEDDDMDGGASGSAAGAGKKLTARQAALANAVDPGHVSLDTELVDVQSLSTTKNKKKVLNETEIALRKEENARKRKNLSEKKLEDEKLETINRLLKKQSRPRARRTGGPSGGVSTPVGPAASTSTITKAKRGGRGGGRGRGGRPPARAAAPAAADDEEEGENMDVEEEVEGVEGEEGEGEEFEGEEEEVESQSVAGGMVLARGGRVVPMYRWTSSVKVVGTANAGSPLVSVVETKKETPEDVHMTDGTAAADNTAMSTDSESKTDVKKETESPEQKQEKHMVLSFSVPVALFSSSSGAVAGSSVSDSVSRADTPKALTPVAPPAVQELPTRPPAATCAVAGCGVKRKYRLVSDWTKGACGIDHLKVLEGRV
ncbi:hypothetical protein D9758_014287 [Tetrapyrgos nigripes]|uniref:INO80 complex subunit B-like conserved region domain-containing protein n=1 Tax=Tetrapyrgos nigripes TaxID=182062 RepID=A0A8H5C417_9AGAR|nr:hypothetical protein D9758_018296 [Tetrapyrgos nigripes]KAF5334850.1 hypothetical protein D9758_014287 [Tetrapyrgos nigripes]